MPHLCREILAHCTRHLTHLIGIYDLRFVFWMVLVASRLTTGSLSAGFVLALGFGYSDQSATLALDPFPSMGFGAFGRLAPAELMLLRSSFVNHILSLERASPYPTYWLGLLRS